ncbi:MAG: protoporphyrinogen oxidase [Pyrinomonadaceae bacterium]
MRRVVIIGGGISGLAAANRLIERHSETGEAIQLTLLEADPRVGGVIRSEPRDGFLLEGGPDSFISEKPQALALAKRLGLESQLIETNSEYRRSFIVRGGSLRPVPEGFHLLAPSLIWPFLTSDILSPLGKARMALDLFLPRNSSNGDESLANFVRRRLGREALERVAQPMIGGIYTADPELLSLRATMPRFLEMEQQHRSLIRAMWKNRPGRSPTVREGSSKSLGAREGSGTSGARYSLFLSFEQGMQTIVDRLTERISNFKSQISDFRSQISDSTAAVGPTIQLNTKVEALAFAEDAAPERSQQGVTFQEGSEKRWRIRTSAGKTIVADAVCLALPAFAAARLLRNVDPQLATQLEAIPYASTATVNLAYKRGDVSHPLNGFGFVVPFIERRTVMACTFSSVKFSGRAPEGYALLRAFVGGALQPEMFELEEEEMVRQVRADLRELLGIEKPPLFTQIAKWPNSMPQYHVGHIERMKRIEQLVSTLPGLALVGNAYTGPGIPDCIRSGESAADLIGI